MEKFVLASSALAWFLAQVTKIVLFLRKQERMGLVAAFTATGGMPSSHSAFVTALAASIFHCSGLSLVFVLSLALAVLTIRDALGVRKTVDHHAHALNGLLAGQGGQSAVPLLPTNAGHYAHEALCGVVLGLVAVAILAQTPLL